MARKIEKVAADLWRAVQVSPSATQQLSNACEYLHSSENFYLSVLPLFVF